jgi:hypothetical protein
MLLATAPRAPAETDPEFPLPEREDDPDEIVYWSRQELPAAQDLLAGVRAAFPADTLNVKAELRSRAGSGRLRGLHHVEMQLDWGREPRVARYTIRDAFGADLEQLIVTLRPGQDPECRYAAGGNLDPAPAPDLFSVIQDTEVTWNDLTLAFLWWPGGQTIGTDKLKGRACYIVEVPVPEASAAPGRDRLRLWIDARANMLIRADELAAGSDTPRRRLEVKSIKKINEIWMVKDLGVTRFPERRRTDIRVTALELAGEPQAPQPLAPES